MLHTPLLLISHWSELGYTDIPSYKESFFQVEPVSSLKVEWQGGISKFKGENKYWRAIRNVCHKDGSGFLYPQLSNPGQHFPQMPMYCNTIDKDQETNIRIPVEHNQINFQVTKNTGFPDGSAVKNPPANAGDTGSVQGLLGWKDPVEKEIATHSSTLAWEIAWIEELQNMGLQRGRHDLATKQKDCGLHFMSKNHIIPH